MISSYIRALLWLIPRYLNENEKDISAMFQVLGKIEKAIGLLEKAVKRCSAL